MRTSRASSSPDRPWPVTRWSRARVTPCDHVRSVAASRTAFRSTDSMYHDREHNAAVIRWRYMNGGDDADDVALVAAMAQGDRAALARIYSRYGGFLLALALRIVRERNEAEDLLHDVFLEAWRCAKDFDPKRGSVRTWLAIRTRSRALDRKKSARVSRNAGDTGLDAVSGNAPQPSPDAERVRNALAALTAEQRRVVDLAYFEGLSCSEIADKIGVPIGTVKSRLAAGLHRLRETLGGGL